MHFTGTLHTKIYLIPVVATLLETSHHHCLLCLPSLGEPESICSAGKQGVEDPNIHPEGPGVPGQTAEGAVISKAAKRKAAKRRNRARRKQPSLFSPHWVLHTAPKNGKPCWIDMSCQWLCTSFARLSFSASCVCQSSLQFFRSVHRYDLISGSQS